MEKINQLLDRAESRIETVNSKRLSTSTTGIIQKAKEENNKINKNKKIYEGNIWVNYA